MQIFFKGIPFIFSKKITKNLLQFLRGCNQAGCTEIAHMQCTKFDENALNCNSGARLFKMNLYHMMHIAYYTCAIGSWELTPVIRPSFNYIMWHSWTEGRFHRSIRSCVISTDFGDLTTSCYKEVVSILFILYVSKQTQKMKRLWPTFVHVLLFKGAGNFPNLLRTSLCDRCNCNRETYLPTLFKDQYSHLMATGATHKSETKIVKTQSLFTFIVCSRTSGLVKIIWTQFFVNFQICLAK